MSAERAPNDIEQGEPMDVNVVAIASLQPGSFLVHRTEDGTKVLVPEKVSTDLWRRIVASLSTVEVEALDHHLPLSA